MCQLCKMSDSVYSEYQNVVVDACRMVDTESIWGTTFKTEGSVTADVDTSPVVAALVVLVGVAVYDNIESRLNQKIRDQLNTSPIGSELRGRAISSIATKFNKGVIRELVRQHNQRVAEVQ